MKLRKPGILYILEMLEEYEHHVAAVAKAVLGHEVCIDLEDITQTMDQIVLIGWEDYFRGETDRGCVEIGLRDFLSQNYAELALKYEKLREEEKRLDKEKKILEEQKQQAAITTKSAIIAAKNAANSELMSKAWIKKFPGMAKSYIKELDSCD